eukprot:m.10539 g.10539  ORF g.10539 m.10539 type:complete len:788 (-) comp5968_c0_seq1:27-2390(-)
MEQLRDRLLKEDDSDSGAAGTERYLRAGEMPVFNDYQYDPKHYRADNPYESLDYDRLENATFRDKFVHCDQRRMDLLKAARFRFDVYRWVMCGLIGGCTALAAFFIDYVVTKISDKKFEAVGDLVQDCGSKTDGCLFLPWFVMVCFNVGFLAVAAGLCIYIAPAAAGSGIPEIKCFLNGIKRREWLTLKTMFVKVFGVLFSVGATMPVGKEGPMIHSGAIIGAGLPQMKSTRHGWDFKMYMFRNDRAKRDFVSAGAAAGVAAAFGAPIGGVLFSLEEGSSFWNQSLTWRVLFSAMCSIFVLNFFVSGTLKGSDPGGGWGNLATGGLIDFGNFDFESGGQPLWKIGDFFIFILIGVVGGIFGAVWNAIQTRITLYRMKVKRSKLGLMGEALFIALTNTSLMFLIAMLAGECQSNPRFSGVDLSHIEVRSYFCSNHTTQYNDLATVAFNPLEKSIHDLFHLDDRISLTACFALFIVMFFTSCWTYGVTIPSGLFVPALVTGAAYGRFVGELINHYTDHEVYRGTYALIGAAAFLGGVVRMTISLTVILIEATNEVTYSFPIMVTLMVAKWVGDYFNKGIYDIHIHLKKIPILEFEAELEMKRFLVGDAMSRELVCLEAVNKLHDILRILRTTSHSCFPVVRYEKGEQGRQKPILLGQILRSQLITMLQHRCYGQLQGDSTTQLAMLHEDFVRKYPQRTPISKIPVPENMDGLYMDVSPYMNTNPYTLTQSCSLSRCYVLFRGLGLRHIPVLDGKEIVGYVTRKELTVFKVHELEHQFDGHGDHGDPGHP